MRAPEAVRRSSGQTLEAVERFPKEWRFESGSLTLCFYSLLSASRLFCTNARFGQTEKGSETGHSWGAFQRWHRVGSHRYYLRCSSGNCLALVGQVLLWRPFLPFTRCGLNRSLG